METWQLAARLADAEDYDVYAADGRAVGRVDQLLYEQHADHPDSLVVRRGRLFSRRWASVPFQAVQSVDARTRSVILNLPSTGVVLLDEVPRR